MVMQIRRAKSQDAESIRQVYRHAFSPAERNTVAALAVELLLAETRPASFALLAAVNGDVAGHIAFTPVFPGTKQQWQGYILAPLGVHPAHQRKGIGAALLKSGIHLLQQQQTDILFVYGDPAYYCRFGFSTDAALNYTPPHALHYPLGWQATPLRAAFEPAGAPVPIRCVQPLNVPELW